METFSVLLALCKGNLPVIGEFPTQRPVTRSFDVFFHLCLNKRLSKQSWGWWFKTPSRPLWRHCNEMLDGEHSTQVIARTNDDQIHLRHFSHTKLTFLPWTRWPPFRKQTIFSDAFSWMKSIYILIKISLKFVPNGPIDNNPALVYIIAWHRISDKPLSKPMLNRFTNAYMRHWGD